jgi:hypothetical protein
MTVMDYQTRDGLAEYGFSIDYEPGRGWRVYIVFQPFQPDNDNNLTLPYQATDDKGRRYVNWSEKLDSPGDARAVAALWAEMVQRHQRTQEETAFYIEQIKQRQRTRSQRKATPCSAEPPSDPHENGSKTQTATNATPAKTARADGVTTGTPATSATRNSASPDAPARHCDRRTSGAFRHRNSGRNARRHR